MLKKVIQKFRKKYKKRSRFSVNGERSIRIFINSRNRIKEKKDVKCMVQD